MLFCLVIINAICLLLLKMENNNNSNYIITTIITIRVGKGINGDFTSCGFIRKFTMLLRMLRAQLPLLAFANDR